MADLLRSDNEILDATVEDAVKKCLAKKQDECYCSINDIKSYNQSLYRRLIRKIISELKGNTRGLSFKHVESVSRLIDKKGSSKIVKLPGGWCVCRQYDNLVFTQEESKKISYCYTFHTIPNNVEIHEIGRKICFRIEKIDKKNRDFGNKKENSEFLDFNEIQFPLVIRNWVPGDRFYPLGLGGSKKLQDFFIDLKVPIRERHHIPVILFQDRIACVCGFRIDDRFKLKPSSKQALKVWISSPRTYTEVSPKKSCQIQYRQ
jgi:tRNA(Ile)-lysidine synthase